jgi:uncharacterized tellurite resistance protein B-like protein
MIDRVLQLLSGRAAPPAKPSADDLQVAVAALLIEAARMDDQFDGAERRTIEHLLAEGFDLPPDAVHELIVSAERAVRQSTQFFPFTQQINKQIAHEDRARILEMMWEVVYADGVLDPQEDMLLRRIAGLIHISDQERGLARQRALAKLAAKKDA